ncbi:C40 family peptidase [Thaumasiovibrio subtropicus]|nr:NlpC/P60 family protein [Thaumasiovibrio subtropicus]
MKRRFRLSVLFILPCLALVGCSSTPTEEGPQRSAVHWPFPSDDRPLDFVTDPIDEYLLIFSRWEGTPYRLGGASEKGIDCSAFVQILHSELSSPVALPRTTRDQVLEGEKVSYKQRQAGDLVFFKTSRSVRHVGILIDKDHFIHASTSKGVTMTRLDNPYWRKRFWQIRRIS